MISSAFNEVPNDLQVVYALSNQCPGSLLDLKKVDRKCLSEKILVVMALKGFRPGFRRHDGRTPIAIKKWILRNTGVRIYRRNIRAHLHDLDGLVKVTNHGVKSVEKLRFKLIDSGLTKIALIFNNGTFEMVYNRKPFNRHADMPQSKAIARFSRFPKPRADMVLIGGARFELTPVPVFTYPSPNRFLNYPHITNSPPSSELRHSIVSCFGYPFSSPTSSSSSMSFSSIASSPCPPTSPAYDTIQSPIPFPLENVKPYKTSFMISDLLA